MTCKKLPVMWIGSCREIICNRYKHCSQRCQHCPHFTKTQWSTCLLMKCLNGFSSASSGIFSMERSTEEHRELFLDAEIFLVAIFSLFSCPVSIFFWLWLFQTSPWSLTKKSDVDWRVLDATGYIGPRCLKPRGLHLHIPERRSNARAAIGSFWVFFKICSLS